MKLNFTKREAFGKNKVDKLRAQGLVPGVAYSKGEEAIHVYAVEKDLVKAYQNAGLSNIIKADFDGEEKNILFKDVQKHPFKNQIMHYDIYLIDMNQNIKAEIPVVLEGRDNVKVQPSVLMQILDTVEIECLPADLPSEALVKVVDMQIGDTMTVEDLDIAKNEKIEILTDRDEIVATLSAPQEEVIEEETSEASVEVPTVAETKEKEEE